MNLKSIRIFGFKSFADRADLTINGNIIAVIGPNGCGKSNIVDALLWGIGEQNPRNLRAQNAEDFIFNGSSKRKSLGYAEVTLHFETNSQDNRNNLNEVVITRRISRSGESNYMINRKNCRLKDITDLLADSGLGKSGYAVVGQKEIDAALAASPYDRRVWIDEAAGIQRYKYRREDTKKKLDSVQEHLTRIDDLLQELGIQYEPLREDAELAKEYLDVLNEHNTLEKSVLIHNHQSTQESIDNLSEKNLNLLSNQSKLEQEQHTLEENISRVEDRHFEYSQKIESLQTKIHAQQLQNVNKEKEIQLLKEKCESNTILKAQFQNEHQRTFAEENNIQSDITENINTLNNIKNQITIIENESTLHNTQQEEKQKEIQQFILEINKDKKDYQEYLAKISEYNNAQKRQEELQEEIREINTNLPDIQAEKDALLQTYQNKKDQLKASQQQIEQLQINFRNSEKEIQLLTDKKRNLLSEKSTLEAKHRGLSATLATHEGLAFGAKNILNAVSKKILENNYTPVIEAISTEEMYVIAIETALGGSANDLITPNELDAKKAIQYLKQSGGGRVTFQPITLMREFYKKDDPNLINQAGVLGWANQLVTFDNQFSPVINNLLGKTLIVQDIDVALKLAKTSGWNKIVSLDGEVVHASGAVSGGKTGKVSHGILQRKTELESIEKNLTQLDTNLNQLESNIAHQQKEFTSLRETIHDKNNLNREEERNLVKEKSSIDKLEHQIHHHTTRIEKLESSLQKLNLTKPESKDDSDILEKDNKLQELQNQLAEIKSRKKYQEDTLANLKNQLRNLEKTGNDLVNKISHIKNRRNEIEIQLNNSDAELETNKNKMAILEESLQEKDTLSEEDTTQLNTYIREKESTILTLKELKNNLKQITTDKEELSREQHQCEISLSKLNNKINNIITTLAEEYELESSEISALYGTIPYEDSYSNTLNSLKRRLKSFGNVNVGAIEAYEKLAARYEELRVERIDITESREELLKGIKELDSLTKEKFLNTFTKVREAFNENFQKIFGSGASELSLTDDSDLLSTGVNVEVTLPGKKKQKLELLSGGERALCACALLFALLKVNPTPIVVLDEVDAPLDGRNVERFVDLLKDFSSTTQFMLITHNPVTIEAATTWIGVTMQEPGVTTLIPYTPEEKSEQNQAYAH